MKIKTSELIDAALDWAVGQCAYDNKVIVEDGIVYFTSPDGYRTGRCTPSTDWSQGGPIIEREIGNLWKNNKLDPSEPDVWTAASYRKAAYTSVVHMDGPTPLIAAMRCYAASKLGDEVDVPKELL